MAMAPELRRCSGADHPLPGGAGWGHPGAGDRGRAGGQQRELGAPGTPHWGLWDSSGPPRHQKATPWVMAVGTCLGTGSCTSLGTVMVSHRPHQGWGAMNIPGSGIGSYKPPRDGDRVLHTSGDWNGVSGTPPGMGTGMGVHAHPWGWGPTHPLGTLMGPPCHTSPHSSPTWVCRMYRMAPGTGSVTTAASSSSGSEAEPTGSPRRNLQHGQALSPQPPPAPPFLPQ